MTERVLVVPTAVLHEAGLFHGFTVHFVLGNCDLEPLSIQQAVYGIGGELHRPFGRLELEGIKIAFLHGDDKNLMNEIEESGDPSASREAKTIDQNHLRADDAHHSTEGVPAVQLPEHGSESGSLTRQRVHENGKRHAHGRGRHHECRKGGGDAHQVDEPRLSGHEAGDRGDNRGERGEGVGECDSGDRYRCTLFDDGWLAAQGLSCASYAGQLE